jgi:ParB/RepB/Spo0J family partition protein
MSTAVAEPAVAADDLATNKPRFEYLWPEQVEESPWQPRRSVDEAAFAAMVASVRERGFLQATLVRPIEGGYQLVAGHQRRKCAQELGISFPAIVREMNDQEAAEATLVENLQRVDLNPIDEARGFQRMIQEFHMKQEDLAGRIQKSQPVISNSLRLLSLPDEVQEMIESGQLSGSHGVALARIADRPFSAKLFATRAADGAWSVSALNIEIAAFLENAKAEEQPTLEEQTEPEPADSKRLVLAVLDADCARTLNSIENSSGVAGDVLEATLALLVESGQAVTEDRGGEVCWRLVPDSSQVGDHDTPSPAERALERKESPTSRAAADRAAKARFALGDRVWWEPKPGTTKSGVIAEVGVALYFVQPDGTTEPRQRVSWKIDDNPLRPYNSESKPEVAAPAARAEGPAADLETTEPETTDPEEAEVAELAETNATPAEKDDVKETPVDVKKAPASKPEPTADDSTQWIKVDKKRLLALQDAGLTIEAIFEAVEKLVEIGAEKGLSLDDMVTTMDSYFNG